jgi:hypothetical protein
METEFDDPIPVKEEMPEGRQPFQKCGSCGFEWSDWREFILDSRVRMLGFQAILNFPDANLLVFEHRCGSSVSVLAKRLRHMVPELESDREEPILFDSGTCNRFCRSIENLEACDRPCACARDRRLIRLVLQMKRENRNAECAEERG